MFCWYVVGYWAGTKTFQSEGFGRRSLTKIRGAFWAILVGAFPGIGWQSACKTGHVEIASGFILFSERTRKAGFHERTPARDNLEQIWSGSAPFKVLKGAMISSSMFEALPQSRGRVRTGFFLM